MTERLTETAAEIEALLVSSIADLFTAVIFPNYGKVTSDGVTLGPTWWSQKLEAQGIVMTPGAIKERALRWRQKARSEAESESTQSPTPGHKGVVRGAKSAIRRHPELARDLLSDPEVRTAIEEEQRNQRLGITPSESERIAQREKEYRRQEKANAARESDPEVLYLINDLVARNGSIEALIENWSSRRRAWNDDSRTVYLREVDRYQRNGETLRYLAEDEDDFNRRAQALIEGEPR